MPYRVATFCFWLVSLVITQGALAQEAKPPLDEASGFDCVITPSERVQIGSPVPGVLEAVLVERSDRVADGQIVAVLDSALERANLELAAAKAKLETEVRLRRATLGFDRRTEQRLASLHATKLASSQDKDRAERDAVLGAWQLRLAKDNLMIREMELKRAEAAVERRQIRSPIDGVVVTRHRSGGEYVEDAPVLDVVRLDPLHVEAIVPMRLFGQIRAGMAAEITPEFGREEAHAATVVLTDPMGDAASGTFGVRLELPNPDHRLPAGLKCRVQFSAEAARLSAVEDPGTPPGQSIFSEALFR